MRDGASLGNAAQKAVLEQFLKRIELSAFLITDGEHFKILPSAKDYKRIGTGDTGPNTGGMGAVSPAPFADKDFMQKVHDRVAAPTIRGLRKEGIDYQAFLLDLFEGIASGTLSECHVDVEDRTAVTIVMAAEGYPGKYATGEPILGLESVKDAYVFQSGTAMKGDQLITNGGRVLSVTAFGKDLEQAIMATYRSAALINFEGRYMRLDIGLDLVKKPTGKAATPQKA